MNTSSTLAELQAALENGAISPEIFQQSLALLAPAELGDLLHWLREFFASAADPQARTQQHAVLQQFVAAVETRLLHEQPAGQENLREALRNYYLQLSADDPDRAGFLRLLAAMSGPAELALLAELLSADPPAAAESCALAVSPLFRRPRFDPSELFPRLLDSLVHPQVAPAALDVMNYLTRSKLLTEHPAASRSRELAALLGEIVGRLTTIEQRREVPDAETQRQVREGVGLVVSLCDCLALIGDRETIGKLRQALGVTHRRIHTEAAYALAKLGETEGKELLLELAAESAARLRVLAYAEELGILDQVAEEFTTPAARAEAELAAWLSEPMQMGMPPHALELIDQQEMFWPGYDGPVPCFLFRFAYKFPAGELSNIGIAGPLTLAFAADLGNLPIETIYAAFAGWQAEHEDIYDIPYHALEGPRLRIAQANVSRLRAEEFTDVKPISLGFFFENCVLIAEARREGVAGIATIDDDEFQWWPTEGIARPLGAREIYAIYKGKRLLETFNG